MSADELKMEEEYRQLHEETNTYLKSLSVMPKNACPLCGIPPEALERMNTALGFFINENARLNALVRKIRKESKDIHKGWP